jgi:hypothetical protein
MICIKCGKKFERHRKKGTVRNNSKVCPICRHKNYTKKCVVCKKKILNPKPRKKICDNQKCMKKYYQKYNKKYYRKNKRKLKEFK